VAEESWRTARLIPTSGIGGPDEQERRATSALLAVLPAVREFGRSVLGPLGAPAGSIETYIEVPFHLGERRVQPDGLIRVTRGQRSWTALVEVKTGSNQLLAEQLESYLDVARQQGFDALITVSNQIPAMAGTHPTAIDKRKLKKVALHHFSWTQLLTEAVMQKVHRGVADPDQAWILGELIRYLEHPRSGAMDFEDMGVAWTGVRDSVVAGTLRTGDKGAAEVASRWDQLMRYACLRLGKRLGVEVQPILSRRELAEPAVRADALLTSLASRGTLDGSLRIPNTVGPITVTADLRAGRISAAVDIDAPREGKQQTRVNWLVRQLKTAPESLRVDCFALHGRGASTSELLKAIRENPGVMVNDPKRELRTFRLILGAPMGTKRGQGRGSFVTSVLDLLDGFYEAVIQDVKPRKDPPEPPEPVVPAALASTALSSQDGPETTASPPRATPVPAPRPGQERKPGTTSVQAEANGDDA